MIRLKDRATAALGQCFGWTVGFLALSRQLVGQIDQGRHIVRMDPAFPVHPACGKLTGFAVGLALGWGLGGCHQA